MDQVEDVRENALAEREAGDPWKMRQRADTAPVGEDTLDLDYFDKASPGVDPDGAERAVEDEKRTKDSAERADHPADQASASDSKVDHEENPAAECEGEGTLPAFLPQEDPSEAETSHLSVDVDDAVPRRAAGEDSGAEEEGPRQEPEHDVEPGASHEDSPSSVAPTQEPQQGDAPPHPESVVAPRRPRRHLRRDRPPADASADSGIGSGPDVLPQLKTGRPPGERKRSQSSRPVVVEERPKRSRRLADVRQLVSEAAAAATAAAAAAISRPPLRIVIPEWLVHQTEHGGRTFATPIYSVDVHPDGTRLATGGGDSCVRIWSTAPLSGRAGPRLLAVLSTHTLPVNCCKWSPPKGALLATAADDGSLMLWERCPPGEGSGSRLLGSRMREADVESYQCLGLLLAHSAAVQDLAWSPSGDRLASCSIDNSVVVWDPTTKTKLKVLHGHEGWVRGLAWDPIDRFLVSSSDDGSLCVWRTQDWTLEHRAENVLVSKSVGMLKQRSNLNRLSVFSRLSWTPDGSFVVCSRGWHQNMFVCPVMARGSGWKLPVFLSGHPVPVTVCRCNPFLYVAESAGGRDGFSWGAGASSASASSAQHPFNVFAAGDSEGMVSVWSNRQAGPLVLFKSLFKDGVMDLAWSPDGLMLLAVSHAGQLASIQFSAGDFGGERLPAGRMQALLQSTYGDDLGAAAPALPASAEELELMNQAEALRSASLATADSLRRPLDDAEGPRRAQPTMAPDEVVARQKVTRLPSGRRVIAPVQMATPHPLAAAAKSSSSCGGVPALAPASQSMVFNGLSLPSSSSSLSAVAAAAALPAAAAGGAAPATAAPAPAAAPAAPAAVLPSPPCPVPSGAPVAAAPGAAVPAPVLPAPAPTVSQGSQSVVPAAQVQVQVQVPAPVTWSQVLLGQAAQRRRARERALMVPLGNDSRVVLMAEADQSGACRLELLRKDEREWTASLGHRQALALALSPRLAAAACADGTLVVLSTSSGRRILPPVALPDAPVFLDLQSGADGRDRLLAVTASGDVYLWEASVDTWSSTFRLRLRTTLQPVAFAAAGVPGAHLTNAWLSGMGVPVVALGNQTTYAFSDQLGSWALVMSTEYSSSEFWPGSLPQSSSGPLAEAQQPAFESVAGQLDAGAMLSSPGGASSLEFLECQVAASLVMRSASEYKRWLGTYFEALAIRSHRSPACMRRLEELCDELTGPPSARVVGVGPSDGEWHPKVLGLDRRELLRQLLPRVAQAAPALGAERLRLLSEAEARVRAPLPALDDKLDHDDDDGDMGMDPFEGMTRFDY